MDYQNWFAQLTSVLTRYAGYWKVVAFEHTQFPWGDPGLTETLAALADEDIDRIDQSTVLQQRLFKQYFPELFELAHPPQHSASRTQTSSLPFWLTNGIGGRKLMQIEKLISCLPESQAPALEWCAGKGHLGRILSSTKQLPVLSVEWQQSLCDAGRELAEKHQVQQRFVQANVLAKDTPLIETQHQAIALHACGDLHTTLLTEATRQHCAQVHLVPCCYHLTAQRYYQPLSHAGQSANLQLSQHDLKLPVQGQITAGARVARLRHTEVSWRLAWQALYEDLTGATRYRPLNSVAKHWFSGEFAAFAVWAAQQHQVSLPENAEWDRYLSIGEQRMQTVKRIELVRHLFRRPLELWLLVDKVLYLQAAGYEVELTEFCEPATTPRNLLIQAYRTSLTA